MSDFKLTPTEISALRTIAREGEVSLQELSRALKKSLPYTSQIESSLVSKGIIEVDRDGRSNKLRFSERIHGIALRLFITEFEHLSLERILSFSNIEVLSSLIGKPVKLDEIVDETNLSKRTVTSSLTNLKALGVVDMTKDFRYQISERFSTLRHALVELRRYLNERMAREVSPDAVIIWQWKKEFLFRTRTPIKRKDCLLTALSKAPDFGIQLFLPDSYYYFRSPFKKRIRVEDVILHALLIGRTDARVLMVVLLLWRKHERGLKTSYLMREAAKYGLKTLVTHIDKFLKEGVSEWEYLPSMEEFKKKASEYGL
ncbi:MAG: hypothetical protein ACE5QW_08915 [Thermoplasmata archaeon]